MVDDDSPMPGTEVHYLKSEHVGDEFKILVAQCPGVGPPSGVLYLGDAFYNFGTAVEIVRLLAPFGDIPPILVVSIGHRHDDGDPHGPAQRSRDFTPSVDATRPPLTPYSYGGASRFASFLGDELKPWVESRYPVDPDDTTYFGYSLGGLFATYLLFNHTGMFKRYGIGSPSLGWDNDLMFDHEARYADTHDDLPARVHFSVGGYENTAGERRWVEQHSEEDRATAEAEAVQEPFDLIADTQRMVDQLRGRQYARLSLDFEVFPGEYHHTAPPLALSRALRYLLNAPR